MAIWQVIVSVQSAEYFITNTSNPDNAQFVNNLVSCTDFSLNGRQFKSEDSASISAKTRYKGYKQVTLGYLRKFYNIDLSGKPIKSDNAVVKEVDSVSLEDKMMSVTLIHNLLHLSIDNLKTVFADKSIALVCVDGAFKPETNTLGYAFTILISGTAYDESDKIITEAPTAVKAEMMAVKLALAKAYALGAKQVFLLYDCAQIYDILVHDKDYRCEDTIAYKNFIKTFQNLMSIHFVKVKGHSGIPLHTHVDVMSGLQVGRLI